MKKFLLSVVAAALATAPVLADEISVTWGDQGYTNAQDVPEISEGDVTISFSKGTHSLAPKYYNADKSLRVYANTGVTPATTNNFTFSVPEGFVIDKIVNDCVSGYLLGATVNTGTLTGEGAVSTWIPTTDTNSVTFEVTKTSRITKTTVTYSQAGGPVLEAAELSFPEAEYEAVIGEEFTAPALSKATDAAAVYSSSNTEVATVDAQTGAVTILSAGTTVITAECAATEVYRGGVASYTLVVKNASVVGVGSHTIICSEADKSGFGGQDATMSADGITFDIAKADGVTNPAYNTSGSDVRVYANGTITVSVPEGYELKNITFNISTQGKKRLAPITASEGEIAAQAKGDDKVIWNGSAKTVTFTVGAQAEYGSDGASKAGQLCFTSVDVTYDVTTGVNAIEANNTEAVYYDLNGRQVKNPANGIFVKIANGKASKVVVK